ncbi:MAG: hypothetical protein ACP5OG_03005 [Candidatus Nanoarchaeia archaeon]
MSTNTMTLTQTSAVNANVKNENAKKNYSRFQEQVKLELENATQKEQENLEIVGLPALSQWQIEKFQKDYASKKISSLLKSGLGAVLAGKDKKVREPFLMAAQNWASSFGWLKVVHTCAQNIRTFADTFEMCLANFNKTETKKQAYENLLCLFDYRFSTLYSKEELFSLFRNSELVVVISAYAEDLLTNACNNVSKSTQDSISYDIAVAKDLIEKASYFMPQHKGIADAAPFYSSLDSEHNLKIQENFTKILDEKEKVFIQVPIRSVNSRVNTLLQKQNYLTESEKEELVFLRAAIDAAISQARRNHKTNSDLVTIELNQFSDQFFFSRI